MQHISQARLLLSRYMKCSSISGGKRRAFNILDYILSGLAHFWMYIHIWNLMHKDVKRLQDPERADNSAS